MKVPPEQSCRAGKGLVVGGPSGYIASVLSEGTEYGTEICPWTIRAKPGQTVNITLVNFARSPDPSGDSSHTPRICYQFAVIREKGVRRSVTECEGGPREVKAYTSSSHQVDISILNRKSTDTYFLLKYEGKWLDLDYSRLFFRYWGHGDSSLKGRQLVNTAGADSIFTPAPSKSPWNIATNSK